MFYYGMVNITACSRSLKFPLVIFTIIFRKVTLPSFSAKHSLEMSFTSSPQRCIVNVRLDPQQGMEHTSNRKFHFTFFPLKILNHVYCYFARVSFTSRCWFISVEVQSSRKDFNNRTSDNWSIIAGSKFSSSSNSSHLRCTYLPYFVLRIQ